MSPFVLALLTIFSHADGVLEESLHFAVTMTQQSCRRGAGDEPFLCTAEPNQEEILRVHLREIRAGAIEEQAFEGTSDHVGMNLAGNVGQYLPQVRVHKSIAAGSVIYTLHFRAFPIGGAGRPTTYETVYFAESALVLPQPIFLVGDRAAPNPNAFKQISFSLRGVGATSPEAPRSL